MSENNNTPALNDNQYFNIEKKGRDGLNQMIEKMGNDLWISRAGFLAESQKDKFLKNSIINISNDDKLKKFTQDRQGLYQIYKCMSESVQAGLVVGGENPLCEIAEFNSGKLQLNIRQEGYRYIVSNSKDSLFKEVEPIIVRHGEEFSIDYAKNRVIHKWDGVAELGDIKGILIKIIKKDGSKTLNFTPMKKIEQIREKSKSYKSYMTKTEKDPKGTAWMTTPWVHDQEQMCIKAVVKMVLKPYAKQIKALSFALSTEEAENYQGKSTADRMGDRLDNINSEPVDKTIKDITPEENEKDEETNEKDTVKDQSTGEKKPLF